VNRRRLLLAALTAAGVPRAARAGAQIEEPLIDSVRSALSGAIAQAAPPRPRFERIEDRLVYLRWLGEMSERLKRRKKEAQTRIEFLETVWYESKRAGLETSLVLGLIQVESGFRKYAISSAGARGYMQVMPFWTRAIGDGDAAAVPHADQHALSAASSCATTSTARRATSSWRWGATTAAAARPSTRTWCSARGASG
jgi:soluble lytic murein transglycosylase-like protein